MAVCKIYLVRHGQSTKNRDNKVGGQHNSPLTELGREQANATKELLSDIHFDAVYSSDLLRASQTAAIISGHPVPKSHQLTELRERSFGEQDGKFPESEWFKLSREYEVRYGELPFEERWNYEYADFVEGDKVLYARVSNALEDIAKKHMGEVILVAGHGGWIRAILMKLGYANLLTAGSFKNAGYVELVANGTDFHIEKVVGADPSGSVAGG